MAFARSAVALGDQLALSFFIARDSSEVQRAEAAPTGDPGQAALRCSSVICKPQRAASLPNTPHTLLQRPSSPVTQPPLPLSVAGWLHPPHVVMVRATTSHPGFFLNQDNNNKKKTRRARRGGR